MPDTQFTFAANPVSHISFGMDSVFQESLRFLALLLYGIQKQSLQMLLLAQYSPFFEEKGRHYFWNRKTHHFNWMFYHSKSSIHHIMGSGTQMNINFEAI